MNCSFPHIETPSDSAESGGVSLSKNNPTCRNALRRA